jgi:hypothetical protein
MSLKKAFIKLMEDVDMNYESPFDPNSGNGITKFAPTPAAKVLKSYQVDGDFLRKAIGHGGVNQQAVDQIMGGIDSQQVDGPLGGNHFDTVLGAFGVGDGAIQTGGVPPIEGGLVPPVGDIMDPNETEPEGGPEGGLAPIDMQIDIEPTTTNIGAGQPSIPNVDSDELTPPEDIEPVDGVEDTDDDQKIHSNI